MNHELDPQQTRAVNAGVADATNVVAGAGTGKTTVLVERFLKLVRDDGVSPERILALTFTLKAAAEMRHRIHRAVTEWAPHLADDLYGAWVMNFHQFGLRLIRENAPALGVDPDVDVVTPAQFRRIELLLRRRFLEGRIDGVPADFGGEMPSPTKMESRFELFFNVAMKCRSDGFDASILRSLCTGEDTPAYVAYVESIVGVARAYDDELRARNLIDFSDMITIPTRGLAENPDLRERYVARFDHILVDEFQDTSRAQNELLRILSGGAFRAVTVVGDRKQSIYRWRDARVENIRDFPGAEEPLALNYRSRQNILDAAYRFISTDPEFADAQRNVRLIAHRGANVHPVVLFHPEKDEDWEEEAAALAAWVRYLTEGAPHEGLGALDESELIGYDDVAVLLRSLKPGNGLPSIERAFERHGIPYAVIGGANAAETRALEAWHAAMSLLLPGSRVRELLAVLEGEPWCASDAVLDSLLHDVKRRPGGVDLLSDDDIARVDDADAAARLRELRDLVEDARRRWISDDFRSFVAWALDESPLATRLFATSPGPSTVRAVQDLVHEVFEALESVSRTDAPAGLSSFLEHLRAAIDDKKFREESDVRLPSDRVRIMTIHQAKGLEFPAVAVAGVKPPPPSSERYFLSRGRGVFFASEDAKRWSRAHADSEDKDYELRMEEQEARCLLYVAMTRAKDFLWVGSPYRDGIRRSRGDRASLFTDLLGCVAGVEPLVVFRRAPGVDRAAGGGDRARAARAVPIDGGELSAALRAWDERRGSLETVHRETAPSPGALDFVTWAGLSSYRTCPLQYRYRFHTRYGDLLGEAEPAADVDGAARDVVEAVAVPGGMPPAAYGALVHDALRRVYGPPADEPGVAACAAAAAFGAGGEGAVTESARRLVDAAVASEVGARGGDVRTEEPFYARLDSLVVHGVFDRIEKGPEGPRVIDYKIGVESPDHAFQVQVYAWALERIEDDEAVGLLCYLREGGARVKRVTSRGAVDAIEDLAYALERSLATGEFAATPGTVCAACPYRSVCPSSLARDGRRG